MWCVGAQKHLIDGSCVGLPLFPVAPILFGHFPALELGRLALLEAPRLFFLVDMHPELDDEAAEIAEVFLHFVDFPVGALPVGLRTKTLHPLHQDAAVPRAIKDSHVACSGEFVIETPEVVMHFLALGGAAVGTTS